MKKTLNIISRSSTLAKIQAHMVGSTISQKYPQISLNYISTKTSGDVNQDLDISNSSTMGVFTSDISNQVVNEKDSIAVHSWKDFPIEDNKKTNIYGTLKRADMRDMLFLKPELKNLQSIDELIIMTSSPRRRYALETNLADLIPISFGKIDFVDIRGNIDTRLKKFMADEAHGIVVAKAAIDRILEYEKSNNISTSPVQTCLEASQWMVLPLSLFPTAPAQGAIGIEVANKNNSLIDLVHSISEEETFDNVANERKLMSRYGGGCSQKIGVSIWEKNNLKIKSINGLTEDGEVLEDFTTISSRLSETDSNKTTNRSNAFPVAKSEKNIFSRRFLDKNTQIGKIKDSVIYITRKTVLKNKPAFTHSCILITSGIKTWRESVKKGYWINGTTDSMGQSELEQLGIITSGKDVIKLSFKENSSDKTDTIDLYELLDPKFPRDFEEREEYFWMSSFAFSVALERYPAIIKKRHASGMGNTYNKIKKLIGQENEITPYLSYEHWLKSLKD